MRKVAFVRLVVDVGLGVCSTHFDSILNFGC